MPKQALPVNQFHGGLNTNSDPRDIAPNEVAAATDVMLDKIGRILPMGAFAAHQVVDGATATNSIGKGLFPFSHDFLEAQNSSGTALDTGDHYLALSDAADTQVDVYSYTGDAWGANRIDLGTASSNFEPCFYQADGAIRVADGNFGNDSTSKWYGYIDRTVFSGLEAAKAIQGWYSEDQEIKAGTLAAFSIGEATGSWGSGGNPTNYDTHGYVSLSVDAYIVDTGGMRGYKRYYYSLIYDGVQESTLKDFGTTDTTWESSNKRYTLYVAPDSFDGNPFSNRVTGIKVYWKKVDSASVAYDDAYLLLTSDFVKGVKSPLSNDYIAWASAGGSNAVKNTTKIEFTDEPRGATYRSETGFKEDEITIAARYKTAVTTNRCTYIGNIYAKTKDSPTAVTHAGDAMIKSPINQFDSFPSSRTLEVVIRDGDEIIHLEEYADRLLQFKRKKLYIINISQEIEFLEAELAHKGVGNSGSVAKTDMGVVWANYHGVFLYNGQQVINLLEKGGVKTISDSTWDSFVASATNDPMVGYIPNKRQVIVADACGASGDGSIFLFDFTTQSWVRGAAATVIDGRKSNFAVDPKYGSLIYHNGATTYEWGEAPAQKAGIDLKTKDIDFGQPGVRKKIYKVYISYKGDGDSVTVQYAVNGDTDTVAPFYRTNADGSSDGTNSDTTPLLDSDTDDWIKAELKPVTSINNVNSVQIQLGGTAEADFEINDMTIIYRGKNVK